MKRLTIFLIFILLFFYKNFSYANLSNYYIKSPNPLKGWKFSDSVKADFADITFLNGKLYIAYSTSDGYLLLGNSEDNVYVGKYIGDIFKAQRGYPLLLRSTDTELELYYLAGIYNGPGKVMKLTYNPSTGEISDKVLGILPDNKLKNMHFIVKDGTVYLLFAHFIVSNNNKKNFVATFYKYGTTNFSSIIVDETLSDTLPLWENYKGDFYLFDLQEYNGDLYAVFYIKSKSDKGKLYFGKIVENSNSFSFEKELVADGLCKYTDEDCPFYLKLAFDDAGNPAIAVLYDDSTYNDTLRIYMKNNDGWSYVSTKVNGDVSFTDTPNLKAFYYSSSYWYVLVEGMQEYASTTSTFRLFKFDGSNFSEILSYDYTSYGSSPTKAKVIDGQLYIVFNNPPKVYKVEGNYLQEITTFFPHHYDVPIRTLGFRAFDGSLHGILAIKDSDTNSTGFYEIYPYSNSTFRLEKIGEVPAPLDNNLLQFQLLFKPDSSEEYFIATTGLSAGAISTVSKEAYVFKKDTSGWQFVKEFSLDGLLDTLNPNSNWGYAFEFANINGNTIKIYGLLYGDNERRLEDVTLDLSSGNTQEVMVDNATDWSSNLFYAVENGVLAYIYYGNFDNTWHLKLYAPSGDTLVNIDRARGNMIVRNIGDYIFVALYDNTLTAPNGELYVFNATSLNLEKTVSIGYCNDNSFTCDEENCTDGIDNDKDGLIDEKVYNGTCSSIGSIQGIYDIYVLNNTILLSNTDLGVFYLDSDHFYRIPNTVIDLANGIMGKSGFLKAYKDVLYDEIFLNYYPITTQKGPNIWLAPKSLYFSTTEINDSEELPININGYCVIPLKPFYHLYFYCHPDKFFKIVNCNLFQLNNGFELNDTDEGYYVTFNPSEEQIYENTLICNLPDDSSFEIALFGRTPNAVPPNQPPEITSFTANPTSGGAPLEVSFTCEATDPDGSIVQYKWDFDGDGQIDSTTETGETTHTYQQAGTYNATCIVVDNDGAEITSQKITITITSSEESTTESSQQTTSESPSGGGCTLSPEAPFSIDLSLWGALLSMYIFSRRRRRSFMKGRK